MAFSSFVIACWFAHFERPAVPTAKTMFHLKGLAKRLNKPPSQLLKDLTIKHRRKIFCKYDGVWYQFSSPPEVIVPYESAKAYALQFKRDLKPPININEIDASHLTRSDHRKVPTAVLLGHFNHGKTTLLDSLGGSTFVEEEKHGITQVRVVYPGWVLRAYA
jgi:hypothetical protein